MFEKFKESKFAKKCKELSHNGGAVIAVVCLLLALTVVLSVSIATNRAKKKYSSETDGTNVSGTENNTEKDGIVDGTVDSPVHNETESLPVSGSVEEFTLALPAQGVITKGHDSSIQVWSETMEDYRVHLGVDIATTEAAPVYAAADGVISKIWDDALMGHCIAISHGDDVFTFYKNLDKTLAEGIEEGADVKCGQQLGTVGDTAIVELAEEPHLHLEMTVKGLATDPRDYFSAEAKEVLNKTDSSFESDAGK